MKYADGPEYDICPSASFCIELSFSALSQRIEMYTVLKLETLCDVREDDLLYFPKVTSYCNSKFYRR